MKSVKSLDFFQKITVDNVAKPTLSGAFISILAIILISYLIIAEISNYHTPSIKKDSIIYHDNTATTTIKTNFALKLFSVPCPMLSIDQEDLVGAHRVDIKENITKLRMDKDNNQLIGSFFAYKTDLLEQSINEKESCYIKGHINIGKAPGDIHFSFHNYQEVWEYLKRVKLFHKINLNHRILSLSFGEEKLKDEIVSRFGVNEHTQSLIKMFSSSISIDQTFPFFLEENHSDSHYNYDYYVKLIPHLFYDEYNDQEFLIYFYSLSYKSKKINIEEEMPIIMMNYDMSPITMKITLHKKSLSKFLIHICAIVGGVFVMFSILNRIFQSLPDFYTNDKSHE